MKTQPRQRNTRAVQGWALLVVMSLCAVGMVTLTGVMNWSMENSALTARNNEYFTTAYAAEAATEKTLSALRQDFQNFGAGYIPNRMATYMTMVPNSIDGSYWTNYVFSGGGVTNQVVVTNIATSNSIYLGPPYQGLAMLGSVYEIIACAQNPSTMYQVRAAVGQQVDVGTIPIFQFAIFYQNDLEMCPGTDMKIIGLVHGNGNVWLAPNNGKKLEFTDTVSAVSSVNSLENPNDPSIRANPAAPVFDAQYPFLAPVDPLTLPVGTNTSGMTSNEGANVAAILQIPNASQGPTSANGTNLLYNKADLIILVSNNTTIVQTGPNMPTPNLQMGSGFNGFLSTNSFYDGREAYTMDTVILNVSNLTAWATTNGPLQSALGNRMIESVYVADMRDTAVIRVTTNSVPTTISWATNTLAYPTANFYLPVATNTSPVTSTNAPVAGSYLPPATTNNAAHPKVYTYNLITSYGYTAYYTTYTTNYATNNVAFAKPAVLLTNGAVLPINGFSVATPDPTYVAGNWNVQLTAAGTSDAGQNVTSHTRPSALLCDSLTVLSGSWNPTQSSTALSNRIARVDDTLNAAILTGNVESYNADAPTHHNHGYYSGGVENFCRFLEDWTSRTFTYNGSMVCMFPSQIATGTWPGTSVVYNPPTRKWAFDSNFTDPGKLPPLTPQVIQLLRGRWETVNPTATSF